MADKYIYVGGVNQFISVGVNGSMIRKYDSLTMDYISQSPILFNNNPIFDALSDKQYIYVSGYQKIWMLNLSDLSVVAGSPIVNGLSLLSLATDKNYLYVGSDGSIDSERVIRKYNLNDLTFIDSSDTYGGDIITLIINGNYIYAGGSVNAKIKRYNLSDLSFVDESASYGSVIRKLIINGNYIYAVGDTTNKIRRYNLSDLSFVDESASYGSWIFDLTIDGNYIYTVGSLGKIKRYNLSDLSFVDESASATYMQDIEIIENVIYVSVSVSSSRRVIQKYNLSDLSLIDETPNYGGIINTFLVTAGMPPSFCETTPYIISGSTCGNSDGKITIIDNPLNYSYFNIYDFTLTDVWGNSYLFNPNGEATGLTSNYYFLTATVKPAYWYYYGRESCTFEWIKIEDSDNTSYLNRVVVTPLQCQPFDVQYGRIYYEVSGLTSGNTFSFDAYTSDLSVYYSATGITSTQGFILRNAEAQCYWVRIKDEVGGCTLLLDNRCVNSIPQFSLSGIKKLWIAAWNDDLDYNYWSTADDDYFLEFEDTSFFTSTKIKEFLSLTGGTTGVTWYSLPVAGKVATLGQKLNKVPQGYIFEDTLSFAISKADADKWTKMATIINPENKWIYVVQCGNGFYWCGGYRHGGRITAYNFDMGAREADNGYKLTISCQSENKLLTNLDENYVINYIL